MRLCYEFEKWTMITFALVSVSSVLLSIILPSLLLTGVFGYPFDSNSSSAERPKTLHGCYAFVAQMFMIGSMFSPTTIDLLDPEIKQHIRNFCNFYHEKTGVWLTTLDEVTLYSHYGEEFRQKYPPPESVREVFTGFGLAE
jgi:hypothetical protein